MQKKIFLKFGLICLVLIINSCRSSSTGCPEEKDVLGTFVGENGETGIVTVNGEAYIQDDLGCLFSLQYFTPGFDSVYVDSAGGLYIMTDDGLFPVTNYFFDDCENYTDLLDVIATSTADVDKHWNSFVLQSPLAPEIEDYVALRQCILNGTCDFLDNRIDVATDPMDATNTVLQFTSVAPTGGMVTAKCSIQRDFNQFSKEDDLWYEAQYYIVSGMPYSIADFENSFFEGSPGPRIVFNGNTLAIENKFGNKTKYYPNSPPTVPIGEWFTVKVHFYFSDVSDGIIELWQDGNLILSVTGINLPLVNSIQNSLEVGVTATDDGCVLLMDNIRLSPVEF